MCPLQQRPPCFYSSPERTKQPLAIERAFHTSSGHRRGGWVRRGVFSWSQFSSSLLNGTESRNKLVFKVLVLKVKVFSTESKCLFWLLSFQTMCPRCFFLLMLTHWCSWLRWSSFAAYILWLQLIIIFSCNLLSFFLHLWLLDGFFFSFTKFWKKNGECHHNYSKPKVTTWWGLQCFDQLIVKTSKSFKLLKESISKSSKSTICRAGVTYFSVKNKWNTHQNSCQLIFSQLTNWLTY